MDSFGSGQGPVEGFSEPLIDSMSNHSLVKKDSALWRYSEKW